MRNGYSAIPERSDLRRLQAGIPASKASLGRRPYTNKYRILPEGFGINTEQFSSDEQPKPFIPSNRRFGLQRLEVRINGIRQWVPIAADRNTIVVPAGVEVIIPLPLNIEEVDRRA